MDTCQQQATELIPLGGNYAHGRSAIVDSADAPRVRAFKWFVAKDGHARTTITRNGKRVALFMHNFVAGNPAVVWDHRNQNKLDNRRINLRPASNSQNNINRAGWSSAGYKGVTRTKWGFWARLGSNGKRLSLGLHKSAEDAARAYDLAALEHFGEFAHLNFPGSVRHIDDVTTFCFYGDKPVRKDRRVS